MKLLLAFLCCAGLCSCETLPVDTSPSDDGDPVASVRSAPGQRNLMDPRTYMDKPDTNLQMLLSSRRFR